MVAAIGYCCLTNEPPAVTSHMHNGSPGNDVEAVDVQVATPVRKDLVYTISLPANIAPLYQTTLYAKVSGYLKWIGPDKGDHVTKGQVVAIIDAPRRNAIAVARPCRRRDRDVEHQQ